MAAPDVATVRSLPLAPRQHPQPSASAPAPPARPDRGGRPKLLSALRHYSLAALGTDASAGLIAALVSVPLAAGFALSSGVAPQAGLASAAIASVIIALLGGSRVQIAGPSGAVLLLASGIVSHHGADGLVLCTMMAGAVLVMLGATGLGWTVKYLPRSALAGFSCGISVLIAASQLEYFFGLTFPSTAIATGRLPDLLALIASNAHTLSWPATLLAEATLLTMVICARRETAVPGAIVALVSGTTIVMLFGVPVATIDSRFFHGLANAWPPIQPPSLRWQDAWTLSPAAFAIALLSAIESLRAASAADRLIGDRHDSRVELIAQGIASLAAPFSGGLPPAGGVTPTLASARAGARTPVAGLVHGLSLLLALLFAAPLVGHVPLPVIAAILLGVAWQAGDWRALPSVLRASRTDAAIWLIVFALTVCADLTQAVPAGLALAALLFIRSGARTTDVARVTEANDGAALPPQVALFDVRGPLLFGGAHALSALTDRLDSLPPVVLLRLREMTTVDAVGLRAFEDLADRIRASGRMILVSDAPPQPAALLARARVSDWLDAAGDSVASPTTEDALAHASAVYREAFEPFGS